MEDRTVLSTLTVTNLNDSGPGSLRQAILTANSNSSATNTINFAPALAGKTIKLTSGQLVVNKSVNIVGSPQSGETISGNNSSRVFTFARGTNTISGLIIANGNSASSSLGGGGILNQAKLTVRGVIIVHNSAPHGGGGGIENAGGTLTVIAAQISSNSAKYNGGGIGNPNGTLTVSSSTISSNSATDGGGIFYGSTTPLTVSSSTISSNSATDGGGIYSASAAVTLDACVVQRNTSRTKGGGIDNAHALTTVDATIVRGNAAVVGPDDINGRISGHTSIVDSHIYP